ncbi:MAG TPA: alcohol dehydrogenase catalytic domain-containing protein [Pyrinomonadaceae bacterium]
MNGEGDVQVDTVPDPRIPAPGDAIVKITSTAICGSDLHPFDGFMPTMEEGDILGHEPMGEVVQVGPGVRKRAAPAVGRAATPLPLPGRRPRHDAPAPRRL